MSGRVDFSFSAALSFSRFTRRDFCSLILLLWLSAGLPVGFSAKRDWLEMILGKLKLAAARFETSTLITFYHWKIFCRCRGLNPGLHSLSCLWYIYCKAALMQTWKLNNSSSRWGVKALSLEVPCQGSWCRCQTFPTWAPRGRLPSQASNIYRPSCKDYSTHHGARIHFDYNL